MENTIVKFYKLQMFDSNHAEIINQSANVYAKHKYQQLIANHHCQVLAFTNYGSRQIRAVDCDPHSWLQVAINLAFFKLFERLLVPCYHTMSNQNELEMQILSPEMAEYFSDSSNEQKLRMAIESRRFFNQLCSNGYSLDEVLRGLVDILLKNPSIKVYFARLPVRNRS